MNLKLYFYFEDTHYFGHNPKTKHAMTENNKEYENLIENDPDCKTFKSGEGFFAIVAEKNFTPPEVIKDIDTFVNFPGVLLVGKCKNRLFEPFYRSNKFTNENDYREIMALVNCSIY